jgi:hypothetical protein
VPASLIANRVSSPPLDVAEPVTLSASLQPQMLITQQAINVSSSGFLPRDVME